MQRAIGFLPQQQALRLQLKGDKLDLDRYLPPENKDANAGAARQNEVKQAVAAAGNSGTTPLPGAPTQQAWSSTPLLPLETLRKLDIEAAIGLSQLTLSKLPIEDARIALTAKGGLINLKELRGDLHGGEFAVRSQLDARPAIPLLTASKQIKRIPLERLLEARGEKAPVRGLLDLNADVRTQGNSEKAWVDALNGNASFSLSDGVLVDASGPTAGAAPAIAAVRAAGKPHSFLHISKAEIDLPPDVDHYSPAVYAKSAENLAKLIADGILIRDAKPCYYAYRLIMGEHTQTGLIAAASVADYDSNRIRKHEFTRPDKEDDRVRQIEALNAQTGPVLLAHPDSDEAEQLIADATAGTPIADLTADDGIKHTVWLIDDEATIARISAVVGAMPNLYIADGHHRTASAVRYGQARRAQPDASRHAQPGSAARRGGSRKRVLGLCHACLLVARITK